MTANLVRVRRQYAEMITAGLDGADPRIRAAFAKIPREDFLGPPPWNVRGASWPLRTEDPSALYHDVLVALDVDKGLNNGSPSLHALMLQRLGVQPGEQVLHVGAGGGYYTAILAELTGAAGQVTAVEFDPALAHAAQSNLRPWPWVTVINGDGAAYPKSQTDRIYVNFALADPASAWLDHLTPGGRLLFPLGAPRPHATGIERYHSARAAILIVTRTADGFAAQLDTQVSFVFAEGPTAGDAGTEEAVYEALGDIPIIPSHPLVRSEIPVRVVRSLHRGPGPPDRTWLSTPRWSLSFDPP
jgi:protein-L-isoaspartate(D-aspartate) O-methyltransferase